MSKIPAGFCFRSNKLVDGGIDDILFACEHVPHWIYGVSLRFQNTCCARADVKPKLILSVSGNVVRGKVRVEKKKGKKISDVLYKVKNTPVGLSLMNSIMSWLGLPEAAFLIVTAH